MPVPAPPTIDTTNLLTILGVVAAAWAVVTPTARLGFRLCMTRIDWLVIVTLVLAIHALVFDEVLRALGAYADFGPSRWGLDKNGAVYGMFLALTAYVFWRSRSFRLSTRKLPLFEQLTVSLLHSRKFAELGELLGQHLGQLLTQDKAAAYRSRLARWVAPSSERRLEEIARGLTARPARATPERISAIDKSRTCLATAIRPGQSSDKGKRAILKKLLSSHDLVTYLALAHPYLCLQAMEPVETMVEDFQDVYFEAMLANTSSVFFTEIRNSQNLNGGHRLRLPEENELICFYCSDIEVAARLGVYSAVGEAMLIRLESDDVLASHLNQPSLRYGENGKWRCPIFTGIYFFRIMVLEGLYQHKADHLWLSYVRHVVDRILPKMRPMQPEDANHEFATPYCYLLYSVVDVTTAWIEDSIHVTDTDPPIAADRTEGRHAYISFQAAETLGGVMLSILASEKVSDRLKAQMLMKILFMLRKLTRKPHLEPLVRAVVAFLMNPYTMGVDETHINEFERIYLAQDHSLRSSTKVIDQALVTARTSLAGRGQIKKP